MDKETVSNTQKETVPNMHKETVSNTQKETIPNMHKKILSEIKDKIRDTTINKIEIVKTEHINNNILWTQLLLYDHDILPIKIDILVNIFKVPKRNIYLSPGTGLNVESNFITPISDNIAIFLANKSYLVIGITPREDAAPQDFNFELMKNWGLQKHTDDFTEIVKLFQSIYNIDYDILGHSAGAAVAFNYSSRVNYHKDKKLKAVRVIDVIGEYPPSSQEFSNAQISLDAANQLINGGTFVDTDIAGFKFITQQAQLDPNGDSGIPRPVPSGGNFTNLGLLHFSLIFTGQLPGILTSITGLPGSWHFKQGFLSGTYQLGDTPIEDTFSLTHTNINTIYSAISLVGSGIYPLAYERDFYALWINSFPLIWTNIKASVFYMNTELGFGDQSYTVGLLTHSTVTYSIVNDYGHADPVYSDTAETDFWNILVLT